MTPKRPERTGHRFGSAHLIPTSIMMRAMEDAPDSPFPHALCSQVHSSQTGGILILIPLYHPRASIPSLAMHTHARAHTNAHEHTDVHTTPHANLCAHPQICTATACQIHAHAYRHMGPQPQAPHPCATAPSMPGPMCSRGGGCRHQSCCISCTLWSGS